MEYVYTPTVCKDQVTKLEDGTEQVKPATFSGSVTMRLMSFDERMEHGGAARSGIADGDKVIGAVREAVKASQPHYVKVDLKRLSDGKVYSSFDDLSYDASCGHILIEVATGLLRGFEGNG